MPVYRSRHPLTQVAPEALVVHCSAARFQQHFEEFLTEGLRLENYSLMAVPGGVQVLTVLDYLPKFAWAGWRWTKFLLDADRPPRVVLLGHEDCRWYQHLFPAAAGPSGQRIADDLRRAGQSLEQRFPKVRVELYYARMGLEDRVEFERA